MARENLNKKKPLYGLLWDRLADPLDIEFEMCRRGGRWRMKSGEMAGNGLFWHWKRAQELMWPEKVWHRWNILELECFLEYRFVGEGGSAASGKSNSAGTNMLMDWYLYPGCTTVIVSSTTRESLEMRGWGEIKRFHKLAKRRYDWLPGNLIEGRQRIVNDERSESIEGRDFRNGIVAVACKKGDTYIGLGEYVGIHNKRVRLLAEECQFLPRAFVDAISNLNKCQDFKLLGLGNFKDISDSLGLICEPAAELGGWDGGIDQVGKTKTWKTRFPNGICIQLPGSDCPNMDAPIGDPIPFPFLITREQMEVDAAYYGRDSLMFTMMDDARMPRGQSTRRVITRQMCLKFGAMEEPVWMGEKRTRIGFMDAAYGGVGGDRCVFGELQFGPDVDGHEIIALIDTAIVPVSVKEVQLPEDQIVDWVKLECTRRNIPPENFFFDSTGRGSLMNAFGRLWSANVNGVEFGGRPSDRKVSEEIDIPCDEYYSKFVSELWYSVRYCIECKQFRGMTEEVMREGIMREWGHVAGNKIEVEPKDKMKLKLGRSPDLFDALVAGVEGARRRGFLIQRLKNDRPQQGLPEWKKQLYDRVSALRGRHKLNYST